MGKIVIIIAIILSAAGCADFKLHVREDIKSIKPSVILISKFELRDMNYDPYAAEELRDALKFEFFRRGFNSVILLKNDHAVSKESEWASGLWRESKGDILIKGVISQRETGFLAERKRETLISFTVFGKNGDVIGEAYYHDSLSAGEERLRRDASDRFVSRLLKELKRD